MNDAFCGWYFRCQSEDHTLALIPALHWANGRRSGSLQIISENGCENIPFPQGEVWVAREHPRAVLGESFFQEQGLSLNVQTDSLSAKGQLRFGPLSPIRYDIMGPFRHLPMECRHSVASMKHRVNGVLRINGREYRFWDGDGYIEGDRGRSFPRRYAWTQCCFSGGSLMLSVADIPLGPLGFTGIIGVIHLNGKEYRLATYLGAQAKKIAKGELVVSQGAMTFSAALLESGAYPLQAPKNGAMTRLIRENVCCRARYCLEVKGRTVLAFESDRAAFEFEYPTS